MRRYIYPLALTPMGLPGIGEPRQGQALSAPETAR